MAVLVIRHRVQQYEAWRTVFDENAALRRAHGAREERVYQGASDVDDVLLYLDWDDGERAWLFARSDDLRESMVVAGVIDHPDVWVLNDDDRISS